MSINTVRAHLTFSFKAETHDLATIIDLDQYIGQEDEGGEGSHGPDFHLLLAKAHGIDPYSYLYEALESHEIEFDTPTGLAVEYCHEGGFDWRGFDRRRREERDLQVVRGIAERVMGIRDLDGHAELKAALLAAYRAGRSA